jgi:hypothetical protein
MKLALRILGVLAFFVIGVICFESRSTGWALVSWFASSLCVTLSLMAHRTREEKRYENKDEEIVKELEKHGGSCDDIDEMSREDAEQITSGYRR